jgi:hypothetical protein
MPFRAVSSPASDTQCRAGDIARLLGGKVQNGIGDLARLADPAHWN